MLLQGSVSELRSKKISPGKSYIAIAMRFYPRGIPRTSRDEYIRLLAPDGELFSDFKKFQKRAGHEAAFRLAHYQKRFTLKLDSLKHLQRLGEISRQKNVYLICQCEVGEMCHREMLLMAAKKLFKIPVGRIFHQYEEFEKRLEKMKVAGAQQNRVEISDARS